MSKNVGKMCFASIIAGGQDDCQQLIDRMHAELLSKKKKNVSIIHLSSQICRALMGKLNRILIT